MVDLNCFLARSYEKNGNVNVVLIIYNYLAHNIDM